MYNPSSQHLFFRFISFLSSLCNPIQLSSHSVDCLRLLPSQRLFSSQPKHLIPSSSSRSSLLLHSSEFPTQHHLCRGNCRSNLMPPLLLLLSTLPLCFLAATYHTNIPTWAQYNALLVWPPTCNSPSVQRSNLQFTIGARATCNSPSEQGPLKGLSCSVAHVTYNGDILSSFFNPP